MPSLDEPFEKVERAKEQLALIEADLQAYASAEPKPYEVFTQQAAQIPIKIVGVRAVRRPPLRLRVLVGEYVQALSASLEYLVWQLSLLTKPDLDTLPDDKPPVTDISFPIFIREPKGGIRGNKRLQFVPDEAKDLIESFQPYKLTTPPEAPWVGPEDHQLWTLYRLNNRAKHRTINFIGLRMDISIVDRTGQVVSYAERNIPFDEESTIGVIPVEGVLQVRPSLDVLFSESTAGRESVAMNTLSDFHNYIGLTILPSFARFFT